MATPIIAVANQKGGVGKTTTAVNLAACLAERRKRVLLIDLDPQANATSGLGMDKQHGRSMYRALLGEEPLDLLVHKTELERLDLVPSELDLAGAEVDIARSERYLHRFKEVATPLAAAGGYDYILVDCPPSLGILTMNALTGADSILIPIQCEYYALEGLSVIAQLVRQLRESGANPALRIEGIVLTMYDARTNLSQQVVQEVLNHFGESVYETLIPRSVRLGEAPSFGKPIILYDRHCTSAAAYRQLAREFLKRRRLAAGEKDPSDDEILESHPVSLETPAQVPMPPDSPPVESPPPPEAPHALA